MEGKKYKNCDKVGECTKSLENFTKNFYWVVEISLCQKVAKFWCVEQHTTETFRFFSLKVHILLSYYVVVAEKDENKKNFRHKLVDEMMKIFQSFGKLAQLWKKIDKHFYVSEKYVQYIFVLLPFIVPNVLENLSGKHEIFILKREKTPYRRRKVKKL